MDDDRLASRRRVTLVVEAYDRDSFTSAMQAAVGLANQQDSDTRVELRVGRRRVAEWSLVMVHAQYDW